MNLLQQIWNFPAHHIALGWWLAAVLTLWNVIAQLLGGFLGRISILSRKFRKSQLEKKVRNIEYLHDNTNGLIRYLALDVAEATVQICWYVIVFAIAFTRVIPVHLSIAIYLLGINIATPVLGRAIRVRSLLNDLRAYPTSLENIKAKLLTFS